MRLVIILFLLTGWIAVTGQTTPTKKDVYVDTDSTYTNPAGKVVQIQNSFPKGGGPYIHFNGKDFSYVIFWTRVVNATATPLQLDINLPRDSLSIFDSPASYLKIFLPQDSMTTEKELLGDYGLTGLQQLVDTGLSKPYMLHRTINPKEPGLFYIAVLLHQARGTARSALILKGQDLFYSIRIGDRKVLIPCGRIAH